MPEEWGGNKPLYITISLTKTKKNIMKQNGIYRGEWAGCSNLNEKREELQKAHEEFQKLLDNGFQIKEVKVRKRQRIQKPKQPREVVVTLGGEWTLRMSFADYKQRGSGLKIIMRIY